MSKDIAVGAVGVNKEGLVAAGTLQLGAPISKKPCYLITLQDAAKNNMVLTRFIALDKPDQSEGFIQVKGIFLEIAEEEIINNFYDVLTSIKKELILEMWFPWHRIHSVRSLVFNAIKAQTVTR